MAVWNQAVVTELGLNLLASGKAVTITRAESGSGTVDTVLLIKQTDVTDPQQALQLTEETREENLLVVRALLENTQLQQGYTMKQIGLFAKTDGQEVLFALMQDENGEVIPSAEEMPEFILEMGLRIPFSNAEEIQLEIQPDTLATKEEVAVKSSIVVIPSGEEIPVSERKENTYYLVEKEDAVTSGTVHVELQDKDGNILHPHTDMQAVGGLGEFSKLYKNVSDQDWNNIKMSGIYGGKNMLNGPAEIPAANWSIGLVMRHNDTHTVQLINGFNSTKKWHYRTSNSGVWTEWKTIADNKTAADRYTKPLSDGGPKTWEEVWKLDAGSYEWVQSYKREWQPDDSPAGAARAVLTIERYDPDQTSNLGRSICATLEYTDGGARLRKYFGQPKTPGTLTDGHWARYLTDDYTANIGRYPKKLTQGINQLPDDNWNSITEAGWYQNDIGSNNPPEGSVPFYEAYATPNAVMATSTKSGAVYTRTRIDNAWNEWRRVNTINTQSICVVGTSTDGWTRADCDYLCDGTADQTEIQAAIQGLGSSGGTILILPGNYVLTGSILIEEDHVDIIGQGNVSFTRNWSDSATRAMFNITGDFCSLRHLNIQNSWETSTNVTDRYGIICEADHLYLMDVTVTSSYGYGVDITGNSGKIEHCQITGGFYLLQIGGDEHKIVYNKISKGHGQGGCFILSGDNNFVSNNYIGNTYDAPLILTADSSIITDNIMVTGGKPEFIRGNNIVFSNNKISGSKGITLDTSNNCSITGNHIDGPFTGSGTGNLVTGNWLATAPTLPAAGNTIEANHIAS